MRIQYEYNIVTTIIIFKVSNISQKKNWQLFFYCISLCLDTE